MMNIFRDYLGRSNSVEPKTEEEELEILYDRVKNSVNLKDRRVAVSTILAIANEQRTKIGLGCLDGLIQIIDKDLADTALSSITLQLLNLLCAKDQKQYGAQPSDKNLSKEEHRTEGTWLTFSSAISEKREYVNSIVKVLDELEYYSRYNAIKLLRILSTNSLTSLQNNLIDIPDGISRIIKLLDERRDIIRNEAILVLLQVTDNHPEIQKLATFKGVVDKTLAIIKSDGVITDDVAVGDSLKLVLKLIGKTSNTQSLVIEPANIRSIIQIFTSDMGIIEISNFDERNSPYMNNPASVKKIDNMCLLLEILCILVDFKDFYSITNKKAMSEGKLLQVLLYLAVFCNAPAKLTIMLFRVLSELFRSNQDYADYVVELLPVNLASDLPNNLIPVLGNALSTYKQKVPYYLIIKALDVKTSISSAICALSTFIIFVGTDTNIKLKMLREVKCYTESDNQKAKILPSVSFPFGFTSVKDSQKILPVLLPVVNAITSRTSVDSLMEKSGNTKRLQNQEDMDEYIIWIACTVISSLIMDNAEAKSIALSTYIDGTASLFELSVFILVVPSKISNPDLESTRRHSTLGILCLLSQWVSDFEPAAVEYLKDNANIRYLVETITNTHQDHFVRSLAAYLYGVLYYECRNNPDVKMKDQHHWLLPFKKEPRTFCDLIETFSEFVPETINIRSFLKSTYTQDKILASVLVDMRFVEKFFSTKDRIVNFLMTHFTKGEELADDNGPNQINKDVGIIRKNTSSISNEITPLEAQIADLRKKLDEANKIIENIVNDKEDLLILIANYHRKVVDLKTRLRNCDQIMLLTRIAEKREHCSNRLQPPCCKTYHEVNH